MGELTRQQKKDFAKSLYMGDPTITQKEIARRVGTNSRKHWAAGSRTRCGKNNARRSSAAVTSSWRALYSQITAIKRAVETRARKAKEDGIEGEPCVTSREADTITKLTNSIKNSKRKPMWSDIVEVANDSGIPPADRSGQSPRIYASVRCFCKRVHAMNGQDKKAFLEWENFIRAFGSRSEVDPFEERADRRRRIKSLEKDPRNGLNTISTSTARLRRLHSTPGPHVGFSPIRNGTK
ncbi:MAG: hypothetical protein ACLR8Y_13215 [Alistipes indistinctus]